MTTNLDVRDYFLFALTAITAKNIVKNYNVIDYHISYNDVYDTSVRIANETMVNTLNENGVGTYFASEPVTIENFENQIREDKKYFWSYDSGMIVVTDFMDEIADKSNKKNRLNIEKLSKEPMSIIYDVKKACEDAGVIEFEEGERPGYSNLLLDIANKVFAGSDTSNPTYGDM